MGVSVPVRLVDRLGHLVDQFVHWNVAVRLGRYRFVYGRVNRSVLVVSFRCGVAAAIVDYRWWRTGVSASGSRLVDVLAVRVVGDDVIVELLLDCEVLLVVDILGVIDWAAIVITAINRLAWVGIATFLSPVLCVLGLLVSRRVAALRIRGDRGRRVGVAVGIGDPGGVGDGEADAKGDS
ncbi:hypothetical protein H7J82_24625 [Mycolicibacterium poriferae]|uniref:hypothetical protein n=1 Tax=Mycolicibacterium poriferae TaxID=39694 RepID=UPI0021F302B1|nr:hypothetical protein [Mycolicibacterium poriferae]MCV7266188.1 hypothetical protein [Mycolicibacterium poriferae]